MIDNLAADRIPDGDPRNVRAIADQIDEPPAPKNVNEWLAPRTRSRTTGELDRSSRDWTIGTEGSNSSRSVNESLSTGLIRLTWLLANATFGVPQNTDRISRTLAQFVTKACAK